MCVLILHLYFLVLKQRALIWYGCYYAVIYWTGPRWDRPGLCVAPGPTHYSVTPPQVFNCFLEKGFWKRKKKVPPGVEDSRAGLRRSLFGLPFTVNGEQRKCVCVWASRPSQKSLPAPRTLTLQQRTRWHPAAEPPLYRTSTRRVFEHTASVPDVLLSSSLLWIWTTGGDNEAPATTAEINTDVPAPPPPPHPNSLSQINVIQRHHLPLSSPSVVRLFSAPSFFFFLSFFFTSVKVRSLVTVTILQGQASCSVLGQLPAQRRRPRRSSSSSRRRRRASGRGGRLQHQILQRLPFSGSTQGLCTCKTLRGRQPERGGASLIPLLCSHWPHFNIAVQGRRKNRGGTLLRRGPLQLCFSKHDT